MKICKFLDIRGRCHNECGCGIKTPYYGHFCAFIFDKLDCDHYTRSTYKHIRCSICNKRFDNTLVECEGYGIVKISFGFGSRFDSIVQGWGDYKICDDCFEKIFLKKQYALKTDLDDIIDDSIPDDYWEGERIDHEY